MKRCRIIMELLQRIQVRLEEDNISGTAAFPNRRMPRLLEPTVMLCATEQTVRPLCFGNLLGQSGYDNVYAAVLNETVTCEIYSPYLSGGYQCDILTANVIRSVCTLLSDGIRLSVQRTSTRYDPDTDCFRSSVIIRSSDWIQCPELRGDV